jgi:hypothetical protein
MRLRALPARVIRSFDRYVRLLPPRSPLRLPQVSYSRGLEGPGDGVSDRTSSMIICSSQRPTMRAKSAGTGVRVRPLRRELVFDTAVHRSGETWPGGCTSYRARVASSGVGRKDCLLRPHDGRRQAGRRTLQFPEKKVAQRAEAQDSLKRPTSENERADPLADQCELVRVVRLRWIWLGPTRSTRIRRATVRRASCRCGTRPRGNRGSIIAVGLGVRDLTSSGLWRTLSPQRVLSGIGLGCSSGQTCGVGSLTPVHEIHDGGFGAAEQKRA